ncbi:MAG: DUF6941 family protein [Planctomycetota bacterium]|jgi:hypothetical protein
MNIEAFLLCDAATDQRGKLNVLGAFDNIFAKETPTRQRGCSIAARIRFSNISVRIGDNASTAAVNLILNIQNLEFKQYGQYQIDLAIDGSVQASLPLHIRPVPQQN